jgi:hypothetical protein
MSVLADVQAKALGIELKDKGDTKNAGNGEGSIHLSLAKNMRFRLGVADVFARSVGVVPLQSWERFEGRTIAGILGADLFKKYVVAVDYDNQTLTLFEPVSVVDCCPHAIRLPVLMAQHGKKSPNRSRNCKHPRG